MDWWAIVILQCVIDLTISNRLWMAGCGQWSTEPCENLQYLPALRLQGPLANAIPARLVNLSTRKVGIPALSNNEPLITRAASTTPGYPMLSHIVASIRLRKPIAVLGVVVKDVGQGVTVTLFGATLVLDISAALSHPGSRSD